MIPFAVTIEGVTKENQAVWVLAVDGDRLLVVNPDRSLSWFPLSACKFVKCVNPEAPVSVIPVQATNVLTPNNHLSGLFPAR